MQIGAPYILPKNEWKIFFCLLFCFSRLKSNKFVGSFFGRTCGTPICFRFYLTFRKMRQCFAFSLGNREDIILWPNFVWKFIFFWLMWKSLKEDDTSLAKGLEWIILLKGGYPMIFASNVFYNSQLIQKCIQNQQQLLILYTFLNPMRVVKNIQRKDDRMNSL